MTERYEWADTLRVLLSFLVVLLHCSIYGILTPPLETTWWFSNVYDGIGHLAVPAFLMLSGFFYNKDRKVKWKKIVRTLVLYLTWSAFYSIINSIMQWGNITLSEAGRDLLNSLIHPYNHLWYLPAIIIVWVSARIINVEAKGTFVAAIISLVATSVYAYAGLDKILPWWTSFIYDYLWWMSFFVIGYRLKKDIWGAKCRPAIYVAFAAAVAVTVFGTAFMMKAGYTNPYIFYEYGTVSIAIMAVSLFEMFRNRDFTNSIIILLTKRHKETLGIYLIHVAIRDVLVKLFVKFGIDMHYIINPIGIIVLALVVWLISCWIVTLWQKIPVIKETVKL